MDGNARYDTALAYAQAILHRLRSRPEASEAEKLSIVTYSLLDALHGIERHDLPEDIAWTTESGR